MTETCRYFDSEEWDERLERHVGRVWDVQDLVEEYKKDYRDIESITGKKTDHIFELDMSDVVAIWGETEPHGFDNVPENCPHDVRKDGLCIFHLSVEKKDDEEAKDELLKKIRQGGKENKEFVGARFGKLNLAYEVLESEADNHHINLRFAQVNELDMSDTIVRQPWYISQSTMGNCHFHHTIFERNSNFTGAEFRERADFSDVNFRGTADFGGTEFRDQSNFSDVKFRESSFSRAKFGGAASFLGTEFREQSNFNDAKFGTVTFISSEFGGVAEFDNAKFRGVAGFTGVEFGERASFKRAEFGGASFISAEFGGRAVFDNAEFGWASFLGAEFREVVFFRRSEFNLRISLSESILSDVSFRGAKASVINLEDTIIHEGDIQQPESGSTFYDFTGATLGDVTIQKQNCDYNMFDHFRFYKTNFNGFDFTDYKDELGSKPEIHEFGYDSDKEQNETPAGLEATYLKAKDGAKNVGDHELASEFFIKEMQYRRERYKDEIKNEELGRKRTAKLEFKRGINWLYEITSGYGEKPIRVILTSLSVVVLFTFLYPIVGIRQAGDGAARTLSYASASAPAEYIDVIAHSFYFSSVTFTTLGYGDMYPVGLSRILSTVQSATGALLIALLIFVFGRSVKW